MLKLTYNSKHLIKAAQRAWPNQNYLQSIVIAFRPSDTAKLWAFDLKFWKTAPSSLLSPIKSYNGTLTPNLPPNMSVHLGFQDLWLVFRDEIMVEVEQLAVKFPNYKIVFTGHSLGASVTEIAALDFALQVGYTERVVLFPFAAPRAGNGVFAELIDTTFPGRVFRLVRVGDPFPTLPPRWLGFSHPYQEHVIYANGTLVICPVAQKDTGECILNQGQLNPELHAPRFYMT